MTFFYKTKKLTNRKGEITIKIIIYDFILGNVAVVTFDAEHQYSIEHQVRHYLRDVKMSYVIKEISQ